jgi:hypothetical protein
LLHQQAKGAATRDNGNSEIPMEVYEVMNKTLGKFKEQGVTFHIQGYFLEDLRKYRGRQISRNRLSGRFSVMESSANERI